MFYLTIVNKKFRHCHSWLARQYHCVDMDHEQVRSGNVDMLQLN